MPVNTITGTENDDSLVGTIGDDVINGLAGNDTLVGGDGNDILDGGDGDDSLDGGLADDTLLGGNGDDQLWDYFGVNNMDGGAGNDLIRSDSVSPGQTLSGGDGDDVLVWQANDSTASGGSGNDVFRIYSSNASVTGGAGIDTYQIRPALGAGNNTITDFAVGAGGDVIDVAFILGDASGYAGPNPFASGHLRLVQSGADTLVQWDGNGAAGGESFTTLFTLTGVNAADLTAANFGGYNPDGSPAIGQTITGTAGSDVFTGTVGADTINGLAGNDTLVGGDGNDILDGGDGDDSLDGGLADDTLLGGNGDDQLWDYNGVNNMEGGAGNDLIRSYSGSPGQTLSGGDGEDDLAWLANDATVSGGSGNDLFRALASNANVTGGAGIDTYQIRPALGAGNTTITDFAVGADGDVIDVAFILGDASGYAGPNPFASGHLRLVQSGADTLVQWDGNGAAGGESFTNLFTLAGVNAADLTGANFGGYNPDGSPAIGQTITGTAGSDVFTGTVGDDVINGLAGNDTLVGGDGNDTLDGGDGDDTLDGGLANDTLIGGNGDDQLWDYFGVNNMDGGAGNDTIKSYSGSPGQTLSGGDGDDVLNWLGENSTVSGGSGNDLFVAWAGNANVTGGAGSDTYQIRPALGAGNTTITDFAVGAGGDVIDAAYILQDAVGYAGPNPFASGHLRLVQSGADTLVQWDPNGATGGESFTTLFILTGVNAGDLTPQNFGGYNPDGGAFIEGTSGNDLLIGTSGNDYITAYAGDDVLTGGGGNDTLDGGDGYDRASFFPGATAGVTVNLNIQGVAQDTGQGMDTLIGIEHVSGTAFNDVLTGNGGDNWLSSGVGTDSDIVSGGAGNDLIEMGGGNHNLSGGAGIDTLALYGFGTDITAAGVTVSLALQGTAQNTEQGMMTATGFENLGGSIYDDTLTGNASANILLGDSGSDALNGGDGNDTLYGDGRMFVANEFNGTGAITLFGDVAAAFGAPAGNDILIGGKGDDFLYGGRGDDVLTGGLGSDVFVIEALSGDDRITDFKIIDTILFDAASGVDAFSDLTLSAVGGNTLISWGTSDSLLVEGVRPNRLNASDFAFGSPPAAGLADDRWAETAFDSGVSDWFALDATGAAHAYWA